MPSQRSADGAKITMKSDVPLNGSQLRTYERIFQHPISHNLGWHDVLGMFRQLGSVETESNGNLKVTRNGQFMVLKPSTSKDVTEADEANGAPPFPGKAIRRSVPRRSRGPKSIGLS